MTTITVLELYSGPGGLSEGFMNSKYGKLKFKVLVANDVDENTSKTYKKNHPNVEFVLGDISLEETKKKITKSIKKITGKNTIDVVIGGPPCQGFSKANKITRKSSNPLNQLVLHFVEMVKRTKPQAFVMENVPGILSMQNGNFAKNLIKKFQELGYHNADYWILDAVDYGAPQFRKRVFFIGSKNNVTIEPPPKTHGSRDYVKSKVLKPYVKLMHAISDLPYIPPNSQSSTSNRYRSSPKSEFQQKMKRNVRLVKNHVITRNNKLVQQRFKSIPQGGNWADVPKKLMQCNGKYNNLKNVHSFIYKRLSQQSPSVTITNFRKAMLIHPTQNRLLSVREAARIQTFRDSYEFCGTLSSMQQQVSDAVPIQLSIAVANSLLKHMKKSLLYVSNKK